MALSDASLNTNDSEISDPPPRPLPHSPALPSISAHHRHSDNGGEVVVTSPTHSDSLPHPPHAHRSAPIAVSSVSLAAASTSPLISRHPRPCFTALPSVEKSQSTQALIHHQPPTDRDGTDQQRLRPAQAETHLLTHPTSDAALKDGIAAVDTNGGDVAPYCDGVVDSLTHSLIKGVRSASCSNVPAKSLSPCPGTEGSSTAVVDSVGPLTSTTELVVRPKDRSTSRLSTTSLASLKSKTAAAASPPKSNISVDSTLHAELRNSGSPSTSSTTVTKEGGGGGGGSGGGYFNSTFSFMPSAVMRKLPSVFGRGGGSPGRKRNAMKPTASQHKALAELASNGELQLLPCNTLNGTQSKVVPKLIRGFLAQTYQYARQRIPTLNEFCKFANAGLCGAVL